MSVNNNFSKLVNECLEKFDSKDDVINCIDAKQKDQYLFDKKTLEREILNQFATTRDLKLTDFEKKILKFLHQSGGDSQRNISIHLGISKSQVSKYVNRLLKRDILWGESFTDFMNDKKDITIYHVDKSIMEWI